MKVNNCIFNCLGTKNQHPLISCYTKKELNSVGTPRVYLFWPRTGLARQTEASTGNVLLLDWERKQVVEIQVTEWETSYRQANMIHPGGYADLKSS